MKKQLLKMSLVLIAALAIFFNPVRAQAGLSSTINDFFITSTGKDAYLGENYSLSINNNLNSISFSGKTRNSYAACKINIYEIYKNESGAVKTRLVLSPVTSLGYVSSFSFNIDFSSLCTEGSRYIIRPSFATGYTDIDGGYNFPPGNYQMTGALMEYLNGSLHLLRYSDVENQNALIRKDRDSVLPENYLDTYMRDSFETNYGLTSEEVSELTAFAKQLILNSNARTDYEKLLCFHDFITQNFYYDSHARNTGLEKTLNPITLLHDYQSVGKIKTVCNGFAAFFQVLSRIEGIPCRTVSGHNLLLPKESWDTEEGIDTINHVWNEVLVDADGNGKKEWVAVDCNSDCANTYSVTSGYVTPLYPIYRYSFFNPSEQLMAINHRYIRYREVDGSFMKPTITSRQCVKGKIQLTWKLDHKPSSAALSDAQKNNLKAYVLYRRTPDTPWTALETIYTEDPAFTYTDKTVKSNIQYQYRLSAIAKSDGSTGYPWLYRNALALTTPTIKTYNPVGKITSLSWPRILGATKYYIYMKVGDDNPDTGEKKEFVLVDTVSSKYNYADIDMTEAMSGENVYFKMLAEKKMGSNTYRSDVSGIKAVVKLDTPRIRSLAYNEEMGGNLLTIRGVEGASKYSVFRSDKKNGIYSPIAQISDLNNLSFLDTNIEDGKWYWYKIRALCVRKGKTSLSERSPFWGVNHPVPELPEAVPEPIGN